MITKTNVPGLVKDGNKLFFPSILLPGNIDKFIDGYNSTRETSYNTLGTFGRWGYDARYKSQDSGWLTTKNYGGVNYTVNHLGRVKYHSNDDYLTNKFVTTYKFYKEGVELMMESVFIHEIEVDVRLVGRSYSELAELMRAYHKYTACTGMFSLVTLARDFLDDETDEYAPYILRPFRNYLEATVFKHFEPFNKHLIEPSTGLPFV